MKAKNLLVAGIATLSLLSCSKEGGKGVPKEPKETSLALSVSAIAITRSIEWTANINDLNINTLIIELYDINKKIIGTGKSLSADQIVAVMNPTPKFEDKSRIVIENISREAVYVKLYAYQKANQVASNLSLGVNNFQNGFDAVPFYPYEGSTANPFDATTGLITINKNATATFDPSTDTDHTSHEIWTVEAKMSAYLARIEVKGTPTASGAVPIGGGDLKPWATIAVTGVYINNIKETVTSTAYTLVTGNHQNWGGGDWVAKHPYTSSGTWSKMFDVNEGQEVHTATNTALFTGENAKVAAYQIFPQGVANSVNYETNKSPHVIVRMLITPDKSVVNKEPYYAFLTLRKFKIHSNGNTTNEYLNLVERGKVYSIDLNTLTALTQSDPNPEPDPNPESPAADLHAKVTIENWTELYLKPDL